MKHNDSELIRCRTVILVIVAIAAASIQPAYCQTDDGTALLLQQSPVDGGSINPGLGVYHYSSNTDVTLTATPKPGYQFVYWLGDVSDPTANTTTVYLDVPKIVIAVYERAKYDFLFVEQRPQSMPVGGLTESAGDYAQGLESAIGAKRPHKFRGSSQTEPPQPDFPVPEKGKDFPVPEPIPEPATVVLLALGSLGLLRKRRI